MNSKKRRQIANLDAVKHDLKDELPKLFQAFDEAYQLYQKEVALTPLESRARGFEASLLNSKMIQCIREHFPEHCRFGKYKRFILHTKGYIILIKKLDSKNMPMNIPTSMSKAISNQTSMPLFDADTYVQEPILFFGYKNNSVGSIKDKMLVYIDDGKVQFSISGADIITITPVVSSNKIEKAAPKLRKNKEGKDGNKKIS